MLDYGNEGLLAFSLQPGHYEAKDIEKPVDQSK